MLKPSSVLSIWTFFTNRGDFQKYALTPLLLSRFSWVVPSAVWRRIQTFYLTEVLDMMAGMTQKELGTFCRMRSLIPTSLPPVVSILIGEVVSWAPICQAALLLESLRLSDCQIVRHCWRVCWCISAHISHGQGDLAGRLCDLTNSFVDPLLQW